ncbi:class I SAM-dependent methyltransferase [Ciceribacter sp. L1K22]|uniref:class I SAM-dependent methyltransferase n=1 Tax=Ciceribacter sp. L1K22 TaxID=2820275 RepID=UPI001ABE8B4F|nr:class I SAM-dependent methyltransferase [Ciceribacter sp. L1K22]MBO3761776.1 class I SAM-dependent methyltransferase [Ciceribacter sp. L1K22]
MSGFDKDWLALREPADHAARHAGLVGSLATHLAKRQTRSIMDIGCGTGSTWRGLNSRLPGIDWLLLDYDETLLKEASRRIGTDNRVRFRQHDLNDLDGLPLEGIGVMTASAVFDLCSEDFCRTVADRLAASGTGLYAALNYDGIMRWSVTHPLDEQMVGFFNDHQRTDKGFGRALGPDATDCLVRVFKAKGFDVKVEDSPWVLDATFGDLQRELLKGLRQPILEISGTAEDRVDEWLAYRMDAITEPGSSSRVGHKDLLALPA